MLPAFVLWLKAKIIENNILFLEEYGLSLFNYKETAHSNIVLSAIIVFFIVSFWAHTNLSTI